MPDGYPMRTLWIRDISRDMTAPEKPPLTPPFAVTLVLVVGCARATP